MRAVSDGLAVLLSAWLVAHGCICELSLLSLTVAPATEACCCSRLHLQLKLAVAHGCTCE